MISKWNYLPLTSNQQQIAQRLEARYPRVPALCKLLAQRGVTSVAEAEKFFKPQLSDLHDPFLMRDMEKAVKLVIKKANEMSLTIKDNYQIREIKENECIDMMGYKIYKTHIELRKRNWKRARRAFLRFKPNDIHLARRVISYYGLIKHTDYVNADKIYQIKQQSPVHYSHDNTAA